MVLVPPVVWCSNMEKALSSGFPEGFLTAFSSPDVSYLASLSTPNFSFVLPKDFQGVLAIYLFISPSINICGILRNSVVCVMCVKECEKVFWRGVFRTTFMHNKSFPKFKWKFSKRGPLVAVSFLLHSIHTSSCLWIDLGGIKIYITLSIYQDNKLQENICFHLFFFFVIT